MRTKQILLALLVLSVAAVEGCGKQQKQAPAAAADTATGSATPIQCGS